MCLLIYLVLFVFYFLLAYFWNISQTEVYRNLNYSDFHLHERIHGEGDFIDNDTFAVDTGKFTGRSPNDKWFVLQSPSDGNVWWGNVNRGITPEVYEDLYKLTIDHYNTVDKVFWVLCFLSFFYFYIFLCSYSFVAPTDLCVRWLFRCQSKVPKEGSICHGACMAVPLRHKHVYSP